MEWFIYQPGGNHIGPVTTELIARGLQTGKVPADAYVAARNGGGWVPLSSVPEITSAVAGPPAAIEPPRTVPPAPPPATTLPPPAPVPAAAPVPASASAPDKPVEKKEPPMRYRRLIPVGVFGVFVFITVVAVAVSFATKPAIQEPSK